jgi:hypothetical protein
MNKRKFEKFKMLCSSFGLNDIEENEEQLENETPSSGDTKPLTPEEKQALKIKLYQESVFDYKPRKKVTSKYRKERQKKNKQQKKSRRINRK